MVDAPAVKPLACPSCGAAIALRTGDLAQVVVCDTCHAVLDARDPNLAILQKMQERVQVKPQIPLGTRGNLKGDAYEAIGFQVRTVNVDGENYAWREYVLWNPYKGIRYLAEYDGHWNDITVAKIAPSEIANGRQPSVNFHGETFKHFQTATATTQFILGEFPWQVRAGDQAQVRDFVSPPHMLSEEATPEETTWSLGTYTAPQRIWEAFGLPGKPPSPHGVFENQPDDYGPQAKELTRLFAWFALIVVAVMLARFGLASRAKVFEGSYGFTPPGSDSAAFVTPVFSIDGRTSNVQVELTANVVNSWAYFNLSLINNETGRTFEFGREVSYYYGSDADGAWSEGGQTDRAYLPAVPAGKYFLRIQPEGPSGDRRTIGYTVRLRRDVPRATFYAVAFILLAAGPAAAVFRMWAFESMRWKESDYAGGDS